MNLFLKKVLSSCFFTLCIVATNAQIIAKYPLITGGSNPVGGTTSIVNANVTASPVVVGANLEAAPNGTYNSTGLRVKLASGFNNWQDVNTNLYHIDVTINPKQNFFFSLSDISFTTTTNNNAEPLFAQAAYQINGAGAFTTLGASISCNTVSVNNITGLSAVFKFGNTYTFRLYFKGTATTKNQHIRIKDLTFNGSVTGLPLVNTTNITSQPSVGANYSANITGTFSTGSGIQTVSQSGFCWAAIPTVPTLTNFNNTVVGTNNFGTTTLNAAISALSVGSSYNARTYVITATDTIYGETLTVKAQSKASVTTNAIINLLSNKATSGGVITDNGSLEILEKGVCWAISPNVPTIADAKTNDGNGSNSYSSLMKNLLPNTNYCVRAYANNNLGTAYGNQICFTTSAAVPSIVVTPTLLDFGDITYNSTAPILSYRVNATYLTPATNIINLTANAGYTICATLNGVYSNTLPISYTGGTITNKIVYVKGFTTPYGSKNGFVLHTGGGAIAPNIDTTFLQTNVVQNQDTLTNRGTEFWTGFGYQNNMEKPPTNSEAAHISVYISTGNVAANVTIEMPGISGAAGFPQTWTIPANSVKEITGFPIGTTDEFNSGNGADSRLYYTGISKRGVHIISNNGVPVSVWMHTYTTNNSAGATMVFPTNTWGSSYSVQSYGGLCNSGKASSFFFIMAKEDNTQIEFTPTNDIVDSSSATIFKEGHVAANVLYKKGIAYTVTLNKGEIFNAMAFVQGSGNNTANGLDLSGTSIKAVDCTKKIAVFGGSGRVLVTTSTGLVDKGSDNLIQQMFPKVAWGTKYLTVPTRTMEFNVFRIYVSDVTTKVWVNNPTHTTPLSNALFNAQGQFYAIEGNKPNLIESDKPISVTQFIIAYTAPDGLDKTHPSIGNGGKGDPEMIILSPVQQTINQATVYSSNFKNSKAGASYLNIIIKKSGIKNFKLDGGFLADTGKYSSYSNIGTPAIYDAGIIDTLYKFFKKHPNDTNYYFAQLRVSSGQNHTMQATTDFSAIAYGVNDGESYGYNAGTAINNLSAVKFSLNPYGVDTSTSSIKTCKNNLVTLQIALPYDTSTVNNITWDAGNDASRYTPNGVQTGAINPATTKPAVVGTIIKDGRTFFIYKSPVQYQFFEDGAYKVKVTINGTFSSDCGGTETQNINIIVGHDDISFNIQAGACGATTALITDNSTAFAGSTILKYIWNFGDGSPLDTVIAGGANNNPTINPHSYPNPITYTVKLTTINSIGCFSTDTLDINLASSITSTFTQSQDTACAGSAVIFTPTSSSNAAKWFWNFGDGSPIDSSNTAPNSIAHSFTLEGSHTITHWVKTSAGCPSAFVKDTIYISHKPIADFILPNSVCVPGFTLFVNNSDTSNAYAALPYSYHWNFGVLSLTNDTSNIKNPSYKYTKAPSAGEYAVSLTTISRFGCVSNIVIKNVTTVYDKPVAIIASSSATKICEGSSASFSDVSTANNQVINGWFWNFGDGGATINQKNPSHIYTKNNLDTVTLFVTTQEGCKSDTVQWYIKVNPKPVAGTKLPSACAGSGVLLFEDRSTIAADDSTQIPFTYTWNFGDGGTSTAKDTTHNFAGLATYFITHTITTLNGCTDIKKDTFTIDGVKPVPKHKIPNNFQICNNETIRVLDSSTVSLGTISKVIINWDYYNRLGLGLPDEIDLSPQNGVMPITTKSYPHKYPTDTTGKNGIIVKIFNYSSKDCYSEDSITVNTYGVPNVVFDTIKGLCAGNGVRFIKTARDFSGKFDNPLRVLPPVYSGTGVVNDSFYAAIAGVGTHFIRVIYETKIPFANHCKDTAYAPITVWDLPTVKFGTGNIKCQQNKVQFLDSSLAAAGSGNINKWLWNFGEPSSGALNLDTLKNPLHSYSSANTFNVTLKVTSDSGCSNTIAVPKPISIYPKPVVGFIPPKGVCVGAAAVFTDTSKISDGTSPFIYKWIFGDPTSTNNLLIGTGSPFNTPAHIYSSGLTDTIRLVVTSINGCSDSAKRAVDNSITFQPTIPVYKINGNTITDTNKITRVCIGTALNFESAFKANAYSWYFGDTSGVFYNDKMLSHTFPLAQNFRGSFYVVDSNGCNTAAVPIKIEIWAAPTPNILINAPFCEGSKVKFSDLSTTPANTGNIKNRTWNFGVVGATDTATITNYTYLNKGNYNISITIKSDSGCVATLNPSQIITINPKPVVGFIAPKGVCKDSASIFTDTSKISDGSVLSYAWNFGDPTSATNFISGVGLPFKTPSHSYSNGVTDTIRLLVTSSNGCADSVKKVVDNSIVFQKVTPQYKINGVAADTNKTYRTCIGTAFNFTAAFKANAFNWQFGDTVGINYTTASISHTYPSAAIYKGNFKMIDSNGCNTATVPINIEIWGLPNPAMQVVKPTCLKNNILFTNQSIAAIGTGNIKTSFWSFGDASASDTNRNPIHIYQNTGKYYITLKVTTDSGCSAIKLVDSIIVNPLPKVKFGIPTSLCLPNAIAKFTDSTTIADNSGGFRYSWNFGDINSINNTSTDKDPTHIYDSSKNYFIKLVVTSKEGCIDSSLPKLLSASILHPKPQAYFTAKSNGISLDKLNPKICFGKTIQFTDSSGSNVAKSFWIWGDDGTTTYLGLTTSYYNLVQPATYPASHYILDKNGCESFKKSFNVDVNGYATVTNGEQFIFEGKTEFLNPVIEGATSVGWTAIYPNAKAINYLDDDSSLNPLCKPLVDSIVYKIVASTDAKCDATGYYTVRRFFAPKIPTAFSPNGDNINDIWDLSSLNNFVGASVQVFNRYGQIILNKLNPQFWNGKDASGQVLPVGTYYYIIKPGYGLQTMSGSITILR